MAMARTFAVFIMVAVVLIVMSITLGGMAVYSKQSSFCASCKVMQTRYAGWERSSHARSVHSKADCIDCHSEPGIIGEFKAHINGARYVLIKLTGNENSPILKGKVYTRSCIQCHKVSDLVSKNPGHEVNHSAHLAHNLECVQCHAGIAHGTLKGDPSAHALEACANCHNQHQAQLSRCGLCHPAVMINNLFMNNRSSKRISM